MTKQRRNNAISDKLFLLKLLTDSKNKSDNQDTISALDDLIIETKRKLRRLYKGNNSPYIYEKAEDEYLLTKMFLPYVMTEEEQKNYIEENSSHCRCDFDCSGEVFTVWMKLFTVNGKTVVYEQTALNV